MTTNTGGGQVDQLKIDPITGKPYTSAGKVSGVDINSVKGTATSKTAVSVDTGADTAENSTTTIVVQGTSGRGIASAAITNRHLILTFTDGASYDAGIVDGDDGVDGVGIASATINGQGHLILTKTNTATVDAGLVKGTNGTDGAGYTAATVDGSGHLILTDTDNQQIDVGVVKGTAGTNGKTILSGSIDPTTEGTNGDFYLNTTSLLLFGPKTTGAWGSGQLLKGTDGLNGKTLLSGTTAPNAGLGTNGDFYLNTTNFNLYGPKGTPSAGWNTATPLKGTDGDDGAPGLIRTVDVMTDLVDLVLASLTDGEVILVKGKTAIFDGEGAIYGWDAASTETADGDLIVELDLPGTGRFKLVQKLFKPYVANSAPPAATDLPTALDLVNFLRTLMVQNGFID